MLNTIINALNEGQDHLCITKGYYICSHNQLSTRDVLNSVSKDAFFDFSNCNIYWSGIDFGTEECRKQLELGKGYIYTVSNIHSDGEQKSFIGYAGDGYYRIWLNNILLTDFPYTKNDEDGSIVQLRKGDNWLICELDIYKSSHYKKLKVNVYNYDMLVAQQDTYLGYLLKSKERISAKPVFSIRDDCLEYFTIVKNDISSDLNHHYSYTLKNIVTNTIDYCADLQLYTETVFPTLHIDNNASGLFYFDIYCDHRLETRSLVLLNSIEKEVDFVLKKLCHCNLKNEELINFHGKIDTIKQCEHLYANNYFYSSSLYLFELLSIYHLLDRGMDGTYYSKPSLYYFLSDIDNQIDNIGIFIPGGYDEKSQYKLVVLNTTGPDHYALFERYKELEVAYRGQHIIFASFMCKGVTTGGYIGEASFIESYKRTVSKFNIDLNAVYLHGTSNGAYSTWTLAESYPHLFAAISPISGIPVQNMLVNLSNMYVYNVHENRYDGLDVYSSYYYPNYVFDLNKFHYDKIEYANEGHVDLYKYILHPHIIDKLIKHTRDEYPPKIKYVSNSAQHTRAYYIEITQVERKAYTAEINSLIENNIWTITSSNVKSVKLKFPPYVDRKNVKIVINGKEVYVDGEPEQVEIDCDTGHMVHAGTSLTTWNSGLLSVYMDKLNIIIPRADGAELKIARVMASPQSSGFISKINVKYPIYEQTEVTEEILSTSNLVIIGHNYSNILITELIEKLPLVFHKSGRDITYAGKIYSDISSFMCVIPNPYNGNRCILFIDYFDEKTYKNNIFLRRMIISSVSSGFNPYLNQSLLLWKDNTAYVAKEWGDDLLSYSEYIGQIRESQYLPFVNWKMNRALDRLSFQCTNVIEDCQRDDVFQGNGNNYDPYCIAENKIINADRIKHAYIDYQNASNSCVAQLFFSRTSKYDYSEEQSIFINIVPNDDRIRRYWLDLSEVREWKGDIKSIRFDPFSYDCEKGQFEIAEIAFCESKNKYASKELFAPVQGVNGWYYMKYIGTDYYVPLNYNETNNRYEDGVLEDIYIQEDMQSCLGRVGSARVWVSPSTRSCKVKINWMAEKLVSGEQLIVRVNNKSIQVIDMVDSSGDLEIDNIHLNAGDMVAVILKSSDYIGKAEAMIIVEIS